MASHSTTCPLDCPDSCGVLVETDERGALKRVRGNPAHPYSRGTLCSKTSIVHEVVQSKNRLLTPLLREGSSFREASWDEAIGVIAEKLAGLPGEELLALCYAGSLGILARQYPMRLVHALGGTLHDSGICSSTSSAGYSAVLGSLIGVDIEEAEEADAILLWGSDIARTVQHLQPMVKRRAKAGVPVLAIDIYRTDTIRALEKWGGRGLIIRPGTDAALALSMARMVFERGWVDRAFLEEQCRGADAFEDHLLTAPSVEEAAGICGVTAESIEELALVLHRARKPFLRTGSGWTRRTNGAMGMRAVCSLAAVLGHADRVHYESAEFFGLAEDVIERPDLREGPEPPRVHQVEIGRELCAGRFRAGLVWGHNPAVTLPDSGAVRKGFARDDFFLVVHDAFLTETARQADVVLPATMFVEHSDVYRSYGHRVVQYGRKVVPPRGEVRSNVAAFGALGRALGLPAECHETDVDGLCEELLRASVDRFGEGVLERLFAGEPVKLEAPRRDGWGTPSGKVELHSESAKAVGQPPMATWVPERATGGGGRFSLVCAPSKHTHNSTYSQSERHLERAGQPCCYLNPIDAVELSMGEGDLASLSNELGKLTFPVRLTDDTPRGLVRVDGMPRSQDVPEGFPLNLLNDATRSDLGDGITYFSTRVEIERCES